MSNRGVYTYKILGKNVYLVADKGLAYTNLDRAIEAAQSPDQIAHIFSPQDFPTLTICLQASYTCNFSCEYCFSHNISRVGRPIFQSYIPRLDRLLDCHRHKQRFYIDLSGDREPLMNLPFVIQCADYANKKQEILRKEILVTFVSNGSLLTDKIARLLKSKGVFFGISLDGPKIVNDSNRVSKGGYSSYDRVLANVASMDDRSFLGCSVTLGRRRFDLVRFLEEIKSIFPTISIKPARLIGENSFAATDIKYWIGEYDKLALHLIAQAKNGDFQLLFCLLNGDDYFGKYLRFAFLGAFPLNRCDAGAGRLYLTDDGFVFPCVPLSECAQLSTYFNEFYPEETGFDFFKENLVRSECDVCKFKLACGGECYVERLHNNFKNNSSLCRFKKHLILLSAFVCDELSAYDSIYGELFAFCVRVCKRKLYNKEFDELVMNNPLKSFAECKQMYYSTRH